MLSVIITFLIIIGAYGLISWCLGGEFLESARGCGGCIIETIIVIVIVIVLIALGIINL